MPLLDSSTRTIGVVTNGNGTNGNGTLNNGRSASAATTLQSSLRRGQSPPDRKVSFRKEIDLCPNCGGRQTLRPKKQPTNGDLNYSSTEGSLSRRYTPTGGGLPVERAIVRTFSVEKMRPICPTCNPIGTTPYPSESHALDEIVKQLGQSQSQLQNNQQHAC